jgi:hypothetical protein
LNQKRHFTTESTESTEKNGAQKERSRVFGLGTGFGPPLFEPFNPFESTMP